MPGAYDSGMPQYEIREAPGMVGVPRERSEPKMAATGYGQAPRYGKGDLTELVVPWKSFHTIGSSLRWHEY